MEVHNAWVIANTDLYWRARASLVISGLRYERDMRRIEKFFNQKTKLANGENLVLWVRSHYDTTDPTSQADLVDKVNKAKLPSSATRADLDKHATLLLMRWERIVTNNRNEPLSYYQRLLSSMPMGMACSTLFLGDPYNSMIAF